jgi:murein DD-endopeptidase MepM/ murein hydrolase activator NlpD
VAVNLALIFPIPAGHAYALGRPFGVEPAAYSKVWPGLCGHDGMDIVCGAGTPVLACHPGKVTLGNDAGYGLYVVVANGPLRTRYAHLSAQDVASGATVAAGQAIGKVGATGFASGPHLHLEFEVAGTHNPCYLGRQDPMLGLLAGGWQP